jgi:hypothetical protein
MRATCRSVRRQAVVAVLAVCAALSGPALQAQDDEEFTKPFQLTEAEKLLAVQLADQAINSRGLRNGSALYLVETELLREKPAIEGQAEKRLARITHYRYDGDLSIFTLIDLSAQSARKMDVTPHAPVPFSHEEYKAAGDLALAHPRVRAALGSRESLVKAEGLALRTSSPGDRFFGHRVLRMMFRLEDDYLVEPIALVDLTAQTVEIETLGAGGKH